MAGGVLGKIDSRNGTNKNKMSFLEPLTRKELAEIKDDKVEFSRRSDINMVLEAVYNGVISASINGETCYRDNRLYPVYLLNAGDEKFLSKLEEKLRYLFPDSQTNIEKKAGKDGFILEMAVVIDWS